MSYGLELLDETNPRCNKLFDGDSVKIYNYFEKQFFGMERPLEKVMRFLRSASMKGEESRQVLLLLGPVGAGKSALIEHIKVALEQCDPIYVLEGCPIREEPLHLVPRSLREEFEETYKIKIEGDLCPVCRHRLIHELDGDYTKFPITSSIYTQKTIHASYPLMVLSMWETAESWNSSKYLRTRSSSFIQ